MGQIIKVINRDGVCVGGEICASSGSVPDTERCRCEDAPAVWKQGLRADGSFARIFGQKEKIRSGGRILAVEIPIRASWVPDNLRLAEVLRTGWLRDAITSVAWLAIWKLDCG